MPKTPPREDEQPEYTEPNTSTPNRRRADPSRRTRSVYYNAEHPEIPTIRRASLNLDEVPHTPMPSSRPTRGEAQYEVDSRPRRARNASYRAPEPIEEDSQDWDEEIPPLPRRARRISYRMPEQVEEDDQDWDEERYTSSKIMVTQRKRPAAYEPPPPAQPRQHTRHSNVGGFPQVNRRNQRLMLFGVGLILMLVFASVFTYFTQNRNAQITIFGANSGSTAGGNAIKPADPHQIVITPSDTGHPAPPVYAASAYLLNADTGATLYAYNPFVHRPMLSTTKLMTMLLAVERGNPDQSVTINDAIDRDINNLSADSSLMGIKKGETYTLRDLLYGSMLVSGNDAATAIADAIGGNEQSFVAMMNQRAHELGLNDTHYMNPHGLLMDQHYSCAHDLAILGKYVMANPLLHEISGTKQYHITQSPQHADHFLINGNQFLWWYPGVDGGKPGWDGATNFNQVISVTRNGHHLIGVVLGTNDWWTDMRDLMNWGFNDFTWISPYDVDFQHPIPYDVSWNYFSRDKKENTIPTTDHGRYYIYTGYSITGPIMHYFDQNGGLKHFGYPESLAAVQNSALITQRFDHGSIQCDTNASSCKQI